MEVLGAQFVPLGNLVTGSPQMDFMLTGVSKFVKCLLQRLAILFRAPNAQICTRSNHRPEVDLAFYAQIEMVMWENVKRQDMQFWSVLFCFVRLSA